MLKKTLLIAFVCFLSAQGLFAQEAFTWSLAVVKNNEGVPFDEAVAMNNGEAFSIQVHADKDCYAYIVLEEANGNMEFYDKSLPYKVKAGVTEIVFGGKFSTSGTSHGQDKLYVVVSAVEQKRLKDAIDAYKKDKTDVNTRRLRDRLFSIKDPKESLEVQVDSFTGSIRSGDKAIAGTKYSGAAVYTKTIVFEH